MSDPAPDPAVRRLADEFLAMAIRAADRDGGKSLGEWLYESLAEPFDFKGKWNPELKPASCANYETGAKAFAKRLAAAFLADEA